MCSVALALAGISTGLQMAGQYQQSRAQAAAYEAQAQAAYQNAKIQNRKTEQVSEQYAQQQRKLDAQRKLVVGQQTAQAGASGIAGNVGSALDVYGASMEAWNEDSINLLNNQRNDTWSGYVNEVNYRNQGNAAMANAKAAKQAGNIQMASTLLGAAASMYGAGGGGSSSSAQNTSYYGGSAAGNAGYLTGSSANAGWQVATAKYGGGNFGLNNFSIARKSWNGQF